jgi:hypothetical protein
MANITGTSQFNAQLRRYGDRTKASLILFSDHFGKGTMENYAKRNAPWTDRTNMARNSLNGGGFLTGYDIVSYIAGGVEYQKWLEVISAGKWAILQPTVLACKNEWKRGIERIVRGG